MAFLSFSNLVFALLLLSALTDLEGKMVSAREAAHHKIQKAKEEEIVWVATALKRQYEGEINWLERLLRDSQSQNKKIVHLEVQLAEEKSIVEAIFAQKRAFADQKEKSLIVRFAYLEEEVQMMFRKLGETKLELSKAHGLSASEVTRSQLEGENHDISTPCKDYEKKIVDARKSVELVVESHINKYLNADKFKAKVF